jgi:hypothetical protein
MVKSAQTVEEWAGAAEADLAAREVGELARGRAWLLAAEEVDREGDRRLET